MQGKINSLVRLRQKFFFFFSSGGKKTRVHLINVPLVFSSSRRQMIRNFSLRLHLLLELL